MGYRQDGALKDALQKMREKPEGQLLADSIKEGWTNAQIYAHAEEILAWALVLHSYSANALLTEDEK